MKKFLLILVSLFSWLHIHAVDVIVTNDAKKIEAKIEEVGPEQIKYRKISNLTGPIFIIPTTDILCVIFENDEVMIFEEKKKEEVKEKQAQTAQVTITKEERAEFNERPQKLVALEGNYSMLYDKNALVYFDVDLGNAQIVKFGRNEMDLEEVICSIGTYNSDHTDFDALDFSKECNNFNTNPLNSKKCYLVPLNSSVAVDKSQYGDYYTMVLKIKYLDVGSGAFSTLSLNSGTAAGGAVIYGELVITDLATNKVVGRILVDRVKGQGTPYANVRLLNTISTMLVPELFHVKKK